MKKDIPIHKVTDVAIAIVPADDEFWDVHILNLKYEPIYNVFISTRGYGERGGQQVATTQMRYFIDGIASRTVHKIEPIACELFDLAHEFWVSFQQEGVMYDKKFIFVSGSISNDYLTQIPILDTEGVMIK